MLVQVTTNMLKFPILSFLAEVSKVEIY